MTFRFFKLPFGEYNVNVTFSAGPLGKGQAFEKATL